MSLMEPPVEVARFDEFTRDPATFDRWMHDAYVDYRRLERDEPAGARFSFTGARAAGLSIATIHHGPRFAAQTETLDDAIVLTTTVAGRITVSAGEEHLEPEVGRPYLMPPARPWVVRGEAFVTETVRIETSELAAAAAGMGWRGEVRFTGLRPRAALETYLADTIEHVRHDVLNGFDALPPLIAGGAARTLAGAVLIAVPSTVADHLTDPPRSGGGSALPATVRRAVAFMDANAHDDIHIEQIAEAARIGPRGLQAAFRRHRGQTPLEYLRTVRMDGAHRDLRAGDPSRGDTVAAIAAAWGFTHAGRFSVEYRRMYGSSPSHTLRN